MKTAIQVLLLLMLLSCAAKPKIERPTRDADSSPPEEIETVSPDLDASPEPIGGSEAIQAALREPEEVSKGNKEGWVLVEATINANGRVVATKIAQSSGFPGMDSEAMLAVARVTWKPARKKGAPITSTVRVPVAFAK